METSLSTNHRQSSFHTTPHSDWSKVISLTIFFSLQVLPLLCNQEISVDRAAGCDVIHRLFEVVASSVFRPVDIPVKALFSPPRHLVGLLH